MGILTFASVVSYSCVVGFCFCMVILMRSMCAVVAVLEILLFLGFTLCVGVALDALGMLVFFWEMLLLSFGVSVVFACVIMGARAMDAARILGRILWNMWLFPVLVGWWCVYVRKKDISMLMVAVFFPSDYEDFGPRCFAHGTGDFLCLNIIEHGAVFGVLGGGVWT